MKKPIYLFIFLMALSLAPAMAQTYSGECGANGDNLTWKYYEDTQTLVIEGSGAMADYDSETNKAPWSGKKIFSVIFPKGITYIGIDAFRWCRWLTTINLSSCTSLTNIGDSAFGTCESFRSIDLSGCTSLTSIENFAFRNCESLTSIDLSECIELKSIGRAAFRNCYSLKSVYLPSSLSHIGLSAFNECNSLTSIDLSACTKLKSIEAFAFENCYSLRSVYLPSSLESIEYKVFSSCKSLTFMVLHTTKPPTINRNTSSKTSKKVRVYVPDDSLSAYKSSPNWTRSFSDFRPLSKLPKGKRRR